MNDKLRRAIEESNYIHAPIPFDPSEAAEVRLAAKPAVTSRPLNITDSLSGWELQGKYGNLELSSDYNGNGKQTLLMTSPTRIDTWEHDYARIYATPSILHRFDREDWTAYNRISFQVRPELPGFKFVSLHLQLINKGEFPVPDFYYREGCHNMNLINHTWNQVVLEIPNIDRDCITGLYFGYDIVGNENEAATTARFYIKDIALEVIEAADPYKGWEVESGRISICGSGYQTGSSKTAIAGKMKTDTFKLVQAGTGKVVLEKEIRKVANGMAEFSVLDFSEVRESGNYLIVAGDEVTRVFPIGDHVWEDSVWKTINVFFCERCGFEVPGVHKYCHGNVVNKYGDKSVVANGGWHDAADMSQNLTNTGEAVYAFFAAALKFREDKPLFTRLVEEGKWGLEWMLKTRFGDGFRTMGSGTSVWTSGILGAEDQINSEAQDLAIENFMAAGAEALAAKVLKDIDPQQSAYLIRVAGEDWQSAYAKIDQEQYVEAMDPARVSSPLLLYAAGCWAACDLYEAGRDPFYKEKAIELAALILSCQQQEIPDWDIPLTGFFYRDTAKRIIQHYNHRSHENEPIMALTRLCGLFPEDLNWMNWYHAVVLYSEYLKQICGLMEPYFVTPASIYHEDEAIDDPELFLKQQPHAEQQMFDDYREQVQQGIRLGGGYYLRRMPVWFSFRGSNAIVLAGGHAAALSAHLRNDRQLAEIAQRQLEWIVGKNPFRQSMMIGEGYDYAQQYVCLPGELTGSMCVGIQSYRNEDIPYWPHSNNAVYRELWVHPSIRHLLLVSQISGPARVTGYLTWEEGAEVSFRLIQSGSVTTVTPEYRTGKVVVNLPAGEYEASYQGKSKRITLLSGKDYELTAPFYTIQSSYAVEENKVHIHLTASGAEAARLELRTSNLKLAEYELQVSAGASVTITAEIINRKQPWLALVIPERRLADKVEIQGGQP